MSPNRPAGLPADAAEHERVPLPVLEPEPEPPGGEQPMAWWEWPFVVLALPLVFARTAWRWSARQLHRFAAWLGRALAAPLRWLRWLGRTAFAPVRWLGGLIAAPARWLHRRLLAVAAWFRRIPDWWWNVIASIYWWARPGIDIPYQFVARLAGLLLHGAAAAARWATAPARRLWSATRVLGLRALGGAARALHGLGRMLSAPVRFVAGGVVAAGRWLAWPVRAGARGLRRFAEPWRRVRARWHAVGERLAATRGRIVARVSPRSPQRDGERRA